MRRAVLALQIFVAAAFAQQQAPLTERIEVAVVNVDVSVSGADGQPVRGLSRDDFEVFEDGRRQPITNFYAVSGLSADLSGAPAPSPVTPPRAAAPHTLQNDGAPPDPRFRRRVLVLVDVFH